MEKKQLTLSNYQIAINFFLVLISVAFLFWVNYSIITSWFGKNGPANLGSIEVSYVSMGRFLVDFGFKTWAPYWYLGFPFHIFYTPLLPILESLLHNLLGVPLWEGYRLLTGIAFILGPISVFFLGWKLSKKIIGGLIAGALFSVGPTLFYFIAAGKEVADDRIALDFWDPRRFTNLVRWGEGPHLLSIVFMPLAALFYLRFIEKRNYKNLILTAIFVGLTALTNAIGLFSVILFIGIVTFVKLSQAKENPIKYLKLAIITGWVSLGFVSFWYNLKFISNFFQEGSGGSSFLVSTFPWGWVIGAVAVILLYFVNRKIIKNFAIATSLWWFLVFFGVVAIYYLSAPANESFRRVEVLPQALRYMVEVDLSFSLLLGVIVAWIFSLVTKKVKILRYLESFLVMGIIALTYLYAKPYFVIAQESSSSVVDLNITREKEVSTWLEKNIDQKKGERIFIPGNYGFYLNFYTNIWQLRGGLFQASSNYWPDHTHYQMANGDDSEIAKAWLTIINAKYAIITTPGSGELYKEIKNFPRFEQFKVVYQDKGDIFYETNLVRPSMAKIVNLASLKSLKVPEKADDKENLLNYADWLENSGKTETTFEVKDNDNYVIRGEIGEGEGLLVQMSADSGWRAKDKLNGKGVGIGKDLMGYLMLYPKVGKFEIELHHGVSWEEIVGYLFTIATIAGIIWLKFRSKLKIF
ncbi:hypothetical protein HYS91_03065 [Candidatus Daviesbacteria bacterium]|nr:hypothetical protein [Candidatus Daviesbacteria bacterium]